MASGVADRSAAESAVAVSRQQQHSIIFDELSEMAENKGIQSTDDVQEDLECPVCLKIPRTTPIYQCDEGHIHCNKCHPQLQDCPICRSPMRNNRSLFAEKILLKLPIDCSYHENGCLEPKKLLKEMAKHEKGCNFRNVKCLERGCEDEFVMSDFRKHFEDKHPQVDLKLNKNIRSFSVKKFSNYFPMHFKTKDHDFILTQTIDDQQKFMFMKLHILGSENDAKKYRCEMKVRSKLHVSILIFFTSSAGNHDHKKY